MKGWWSHFQKPRFVKQKTLKFIGKRKSVNWLKCSICPYTNCKTKYTHYSLIIHCVSAHCFHANRQLIKKQIYIYVHNLIMQIYFSLRVILDIPPFFFFKGGVTQSRIILLPAQFIMSASRKFLFFKKEKKKGTKLLILIRSKQKSRLWFWCILPV